MTEETDLDSGEARLRRATERYVKVLGGNCCGFGKGVELITHMKRPDRALDWYRRFIRSRVDTEECADVQIELNQTQGFHFWQLATLRRDFKEWKRLEKSRSAKQNRAKRGRVKSKDDKRLRARFEGKPIPYSKKI